MRSRLAPIVVSLVLLAACSDPPSLLVDIRTDLVPEVEFSFARTQLSTRVFASDAGAAEAASMEESVLADDPYRDGVRVATFDGLQEGESYFVRVQLLTADRAVALERTVSVRLEGSQVVTVLLSRACRDVVCPGPGDDPSATECVGGRCLAPCAPGDPECTGDQCQTASDCPPAGDECSRPTCEEGGCFFEEVRGVCGDLMACVPGRGCVVTCVAQPELCNELDEDCDRRFDEDFDTDTDPLHCGGCGLRCSFVNNTPGCAAGDCTVSCDPGFGDCDADARNGCETPLSTDADCGNCGDACGGGTPLCAPSAGSFACVSSCPTDTTVCGNECADLNTSRTHCGGCGAACGPGEVCTGGQCVCGPDTGNAGTGAACADASSCCPSVGCVNTDSDTDHCGGCGVACGASETCAAGACQCAASTGAPGAGAVCGGATSTCCPPTGCVDTNSTPSHCGGCDVGCGPNEPCLGGACQCGPTNGSGGGGPACTGANACCPPDGCASITTDENHCGGCGITCGASESCTSGACACGALVAPAGSGAVCGAGSTCCPASGCRDIDVDVVNCGGCGVACGPAELCVGGSCGCSDERGIVGGGPICSADDRCCPAGCVNVNTDPLNCGDCGIVCPEGETCSGGCRCDGGAPCGAGDVCCPGQGCVRLDTDPSNCGGCGVTCGGGESCVGGACRCAGVAGLPGGGPVCPADDTCCPASGCASLASDAANCGACGVACGVGERCNAGACRCGTDSGTMGNGPACPDAQRCCPGDRCRPNMELCP